MTKFFPLKTLGIAGIRHIKYESTRAALAALGLKVAT